MTKLEERRKQYGIPRRPYLPKGKVVLVYRLPAEERTAGGLVIPAQAEEAKSMGILVAAGLAARDEMHDALIDLGDVVWFGRFAGYEKEVERDPEGKGRNIISMMIQDINGSVDADDREADYELLYNEEEGEHYYAKKTSRRKAA
jgi:chaperonin GroES